MEDRTITRLELAEGLQTAPDATADVIQRMRINLDKVVKHLYVRRRIDRLLNLDGNWMEANVRDTWAEVLRLLAAGDDRFEIHTEYKLQTTAAVLRRTAGEARLDKLGESSTAANRLMTSAKADIVLTFSANLQVGARPPVEVSVPMVVIEVKRKNSVDFARRGISKLFWHLYLSSRVYTSTCAIYLAGPCYWIFTLDKDGTLWHHGIQRSVEADNLLRYANEVAAYCTDMPRLPPESGNDATARLHDLIDFLAPQVEYGAKLEKRVPGEYGVVCRESAPEYPLQGAVHVTELELDAATARLLQRQASTDTSASLRINSREATKSGGGDGGRGGRGGDLDKSVDQGLREQGAGPPGPHSGGRSNATRSKHSGGAGERGSDTSGRDGEHAQEGLDEFGSRASSSPRLHAAPDRITPLPTPPRFGAIKSKSIAPLLIPSNTGIENSMETCSIARRLKEAGETTMVISRWSLNPSDVAWKDKPIPIRGEGGRPEDSSKSSDDVTSSSLPEYCKMVLRAIPVRAYRAVS